MDQDNYELLLSKLNEFEDKLKQQEERLQDMITFNKSLLNSKQVNQTQPKNDYQERLEKGLKR